MPFSGFVGIPYRNGEGHSIGLPESWVKISDHPQPIPKAYRFSSSFQLGPLRLHMIHISYLIFADLSNLTHIILILISLLGL